MRKRMRNIFIATALCALLPSVGKAQSPTVCPVYHTFDDQVTWSVTSLPSYWSYAGMPTPYNPVFHFTAGVNFYGGFYTATFSFSDIVSNDSYSLLSNPTLEATCAKAISNITGADTTWTTLFHDAEWAGSFSITWHVDVADHGGGSGGSQVISDCDEEYVLEISWDGGATWNQVGAPFSPC